MYEEFYWPTRGVTFFIILTNHILIFRESCSRGWKLMMLCTAYFDCSQLLRPYINKYFQSAGDPKREFHGKI